MNKPLVLLPADLILWLLSGTYFDMLLTLLNTFRSVLTDCFLFYFLYTKSSALILMIFILTLWSVDLNLLILNVAANTLHLC